MKRSDLRVVVLSCLLLVFTLLVMGLPVNAQDTPKRGGTFKLAYHTNIPTLDCMNTSAVAAYDIGGHIFETLVQFITADNKIAPELADSWEVSKDKLRFTFKLRRDVRFHDGSEMTSEDVQASIERWLKYGTRGGNVSPFVDRLATPDKYTFQILLKWPYAPLLSLLGFGSGPIILPASIAKKAGREMLHPESCIGTGPYKFGKWVQGEFVRLDRWDGYVPRKEPPNGRAGEKIAYFDHVEFHIMEETAARVNGVMSGQYQYATQIPTDLYDSLVKDPKIRLIKPEPPMWCAILFNTREGLCTNQGLRQAILAVLSMDEIIKATYGPLGYVQGSLFPKVTPWYSKAGLEKYNQKNPELGWQLAQKAGYKGEKIRMLVGNTWPVNDLCQVVAKQLKDAGFNIDFQVYDWAGVVANRSKPDKWELFITYSIGAYYDPGHAFWLTPTAPGWWDTPEKGAVLKDFVATYDFKARHELWAKFQELVYTQVPIIKLGDYHSIDIAATEDRIKGLGTSTHPFHAFMYNWNMWFAK
jgi:peptide/nickel transport system substrate-binding protein